MHTLNFVQKLSCLDHVGNWPISSSQIFDMMIQWWQQLQQEHSESTNLCQCHNFSQKWLRIKICIFGLIRILMSVRYIPCERRSFCQVWYKSAVDCMRIALCQCLASFVDVRFLRASVMLFIEWQNDHITSALLVEVITRNKLPSVQMLSAWKLYTSDVSIEDKKEFSCKCREKCYKCSGCSTQFYIAFALSSVTK